MSEGDSLTTHARSGPSAPDRPPYPRDDGVSVYVSDVHTEQVYRVALPPADLDKCVPFSYLRFAVSVFTLLLVLTDIPRTGFSMQLQQFFMSPRPGVVMYYGPYDYPAAHIAQEKANHSSVDFIGRIGAKPIDNLSTWSYKFDTVSISWRAMAKHLNVSSFPACLLYQEPCSSSHLNLQTVFVMLDDAMSALKTRYFDSKDKALPVLFHTTVNWFDSLHHVLGSFWWPAHHHKRLHMIHFFKPQDGRSIFICNKSRRRISRPVICENPLAWLCPHPSAKYKAQVPIAKHIDIRFATSQRENPTLELELLVIVNRQVITGARKSLLPMVYYITEYLEVIAFTRGRRCVTLNDCETVFVDEYRYEEGTIKSSVKEWRSRLTVLRGGAQLYIWIKVILLWWGCFRTRSDEPKYRESSLWEKCSIATITFFKIPGHVIVYSSWFPVCCYSLAHVIDSSLIHLISDSALSGSADFHFVRYVLVAAVQMRNVWILALFWKVVLLLHSCWMGGRARTWQPQDGVLGIRGVLISSTSWMTIFSFLRAARFRDTDIKAIFEIPRTVSFHDERLAFTYTNVAEFGLELDAKTLLITSLVLIAGGLVFQLAIVVATQQWVPLFFWRSFCVPWSTGVVYPSSMLTICWNNPLEVLDSQARRSSWRLRVVSQIGSLKSVSRGSSLRKSPSLDRSLRSVQRPSPLRQSPQQLGIETRQKEVWSFVRLVNIGMLSDPWQMYQAKQKTRLFYLYRVKTSFQTSLHQEMNVVERLILLPRPYSPSRLQPNVRSHLEVVDAPVLVAVVDASLLSWSALVSLG